MLEPSGYVMKGATTLATLQVLGVAPSFSRPAVSNDNPYSDSLFKKMKYRLICLHQAFENLLASHQWVGIFVQWYKHEHRHSAIRFVTPAQRHECIDISMLKKRAIVYEAAKQQRLERWSGATRNWQPVLVVHLWSCPYATVV